MEITLTSEITVESIDKMGGDHSVVAAAKVSTTGQEARKWAGPERSSDCYGLINYLMKHRHGTPFEHSALTFFVHAPGMVWWEWIRHRIGQTVDCETEQSFNLESGRYKVLDPVFWIPRPDRKMTPAPGHKAARPRYEAIDRDRYDRSIARKKLAYEAAWLAYQGDLADGIANETARSVFGYGIYYSGWVTCNPRSLMHFISLRTHDPEATFVSHPQAEIEEAARAAEALLLEGWPLTYQAFCENGRVGP